MKTFRKLLKGIAPKAFNDGLDKCNRLGKKAIKQKNVDKFLDLGCGDGKLTLEFAQHIQAKNIYAVEFLDDMRLEAEKKSIKCYKWDLNNIWEFEDNYFDVILSSQNIEHMHNTRRYLEECYRILKPGGQIIVLTENLASWINIGALLFGWQPFSTTNIDGWSVGNPLIWHLDEYKDEEVIRQHRATGVDGTTGHIRVLTYHGLKDMLSKTSFKNIKMHSRGYLPLFGWISNVLCSIDKWHGHFLIASGYK